MRMIAVGGRDANEMICRNFKNFGEVEIELGNPVVFIGPNNSGKTTALQALALWEIGLKRWNENRKGKTNPEKRPGVVINRRDLISVPVPDARLLWRDLQVRNVKRVDNEECPYRRRGCYGWFGNVVSSLTMPIRSPFIVAL